MNTIKPTGLAVLGTLIFLSAFAATDAADDTIDASAAASRAALVERGGYLVTTSGCNDCHTPLKQGPNGPEPDWSRMLSGHPQDLVMPASPVLPDGRGGSPWPAPSPPGREAGARVSQPT